MATKKYLDQQGLKTLIQGLKAKNDALYAAVGHAHAASEISYKNANIKGGADIKVDEALDVLIANVVRATEDLSTTDGNVKELEKAINALKTQVGEGTVVDKIQAVQTALYNFKTAQATKDQAQDTAIETAQQAADDATAAVETEKGRAEGAEKGLADRLVVIEGEGEGSIKKALADAKTYADGKNAAIEAAQAAAEAAQADVNALEGKVGEVPAEKTVIGLIGEVKAQADQGVADAAAEATRAQDVEQGLRDDLGQKADPAAAEGSAFARIAQLKVDLADEATTARAAEQANAAAAKAVQDNVDALGAKVGEVPADKTVVQMIAEAKTEATYDDTALKGRVKAIEDDYLKAADKTELQGKIDTAKATADDAKTKIDAFMLAADVKEGAVDTLKEIQDYITSDGTAAQKMTQDIATNAQAIKAEADRAKAAEKANADDIAVLKGADTVEGSVAKAVKVAKEAVMTEVDKKADQTALNTEIQERKDADKALADRLDIVQGAETVDGSIAKALKDAKTYTDTQIDGMALTEAEIDAMLAEVYSAPQA